MWEGPQAGMGEACEGEGAAEIKSLGLAATPIFCSSALLGLERELMLSLGRRKRCGEGVFICVFVYHSPTLFLVNNKLS